MQIYMGHGTKEFAFLVECIILSRTQLYLPDIRPFGDADHKFEEAQNWVCVPTTIQSPLL